MWNCAKKTVQMKKVNNNNNKNVHDEWKSLFSFNKQKHNYPHRCCNVCHVGDEDDWYKETKEHLLRDNNAVETTLGCVPHTWTLQADIFRIPKNWKSRAWLSIRRAKLSTLSCTAQLVVLFWTPWEHSNNLKIKSNQQNNN